MNIGLAFGSLISALPILILIIVLVLFLRQRKAQSELDIPPLDLVDAKKLDDLVTKQVEEALKPLLESKGYTDEQMKEILTKTSSLGKPTFRR